MYIIMRLPVQAMFENFANIGRGLFQLLHQSNFTTFQNITCTINRLLKAETYNIDRQFSFK